MIPQHANCASAPTPRAAANLSAQSAEEFIYLISHDVRSSVRALLELPQWIAEDLEEAGFDMGGPIADSIDMMNRHTRRLDRMLVDLLTYSRVGRMQTLGEVDIDLALDLALEALAIPPEFKVERDFLSGNVFMGDRDAQTLLTALVDNAVKHHDQQTGRITVSARGEAGMFVLTVTDDGPGIAPAFHERVFQPMTTLRSRDDVEGTGLGLANVRKIAEHYGGRAELLPAPQGRGAAVEVRIYPAALPAAE